jgi:hypothetical protein
MIYLEAKVGAKRAREVAKDMESVIVHSLVSVQNILIADQRCVELWVSKECTLFGLVVQVWLRYSVRPGSEAVALGSECFSFLST